MIELDKSPRRSPIHELTAARRPQWGTISGMPTAVRFQAMEIEREAMSSLALCDASGLLKLGLKGSDAHDLLADAGISIPAAIYETAALADGGLIVRWGNEEFFVESGITGEAVRTIEERLGEFAGRARAVERQDATFLLIGARINEVLAQTCGLDLAAAARHRYIATRVAGINCGLLPGDINGLPAYRLWVDSSYAESLWEAFAAIAAELDGAIIGAGTVWPEWL